jgi:2,4-dienoyl-CoA reductase-like NADH-dependent reductase (Old Yellow Enzyme family)
VSGKDVMISLDMPFEGPRFEAFKAMAAAGKANGSLMVAQISHPGRQMQVQFGSEVLAPSAVQLGKCNVAISWLRPLG